MRWQLLTLVAMAGAALAQTTTQQPVAPNTSGMVIQGGYASTPVTAPTVMTPHVTLGVASANPVGATSSASGLQVGATSGAIPPAVGQQTVVNEAIVSSGNTNQGNVRTGTGTAATIVAPGPSSPQEAGNTGANANVSTGVIGAVEPGPDVAAASRYYKTHPLHATKVYTNADIDRLTQTEPADATALPSSDSNAPNPATSNPASTMPQGESSAAPQSQPSASPSAAPPETKSKPAPYTPPATPPQ